MKFRQSDWEPVLEYRSTRSAALTSASFEAACPQKSLSSKLRAVVAAFQAAPEWGILAHGNTRRPFGTLVPMDSLIQSEA